MKEQDRELYGLLLAANQRLNEVGDLSIWVLILLAVFSSVGLHLEWLDEIIGYPLGNLRNVYVHLLIWLAAFAVFGISLEIGRRAAYARIRLELAALMRRSGYTQYTLLAEIEHDPELKLIAESLKQDREMHRLPTHLKL